MWIRSAVACLAVVCALASPVSASPVTINFDNFSELTSLTGEIPSLTFDNAIVLTAGSLLGDSFPPRSGNNVIHDDRGPMWIIFSGFINSFSAYLTYSSPITLTAYDVNGTVLDSHASLFSENYLSSSVNAPNELMSLTAPDIFLVTVSGSLRGGSFTLDDLTYDNGTLTDDTSTNVPERSNSIQLAGVVAIALILFGRSIPS